MILSVAGAAEWEGMVWNCPVHEWHRAVCMWDGFNMFLPMAFDLNNENLSKYFYNNYTLLFWIGIYIIFFSPHSHCAGDRQFFLDSAGCDSCPIATTHSPSPSFRLRGCMRATGCCLWNGHINGCMMNQPEMTGRRYMRGVSDGRTNERTIECWRAEGGDEMANRHSSKFFDH